MNIDELKSEYKIVKERYDELKQSGLKLDMSRGKPGKDQLGISADMLDILNSDSQLITEEGVDCRNYGLLDGIFEIKEIFSKMMEVPSDNIMVGGNSSLNMMFDTISCFMTKGIDGCKPWIKQDKIKFLCPVPGYDRHFAITEYFEFEMINIPMLSTGPDMDMIENLVADDETIKGIWCVPKYSNPQGITYSDETVRRLANLHPKAKDFRIFWDNAYCVHDLTEKGTKLLNIFDECKKTGNEDLPIIFCSTSKVTFPGSGVAAMAASDNNMKVIMEKYKYQTIGYDKINMLRHVRYFKDYNGILEHMKRHRDILKPKFDVVTDSLDREIKDRNLAKWQKPDGGYFVSVNVYNGCATRTVELCAQAGVKLTGAGAAFPYGKDPDDSNIRIAPSYPSIEELEKAMEVFCISLRLAVLEKEINI
ncbi:MAG: aminotransferase class I/II-fold pyridoxal phosphate-dependent enzyme [Clostridia bacterium]|nr:aminotransferase class I/II-fold pyridoxal phosphate-dependent enzyme [Clostridia bacterium]